MKKTVQLFFLLTASLLVINATSCKKKLKDSDIQAAIVTALQADASMAGTTVEVKDGIATISGECKDESCKMKCEEVVKKIEGVKSVINNCSIAPVVAPVVDGLQKSINEVLKDFPSVKAELNEGVLKLSGEIERARLQKLMMGLNALRTMGIKNIESTDLIKK
jgi:hypothetical protein